MAINKDKLLKEVKNKVEEKNKNSNSSDNNNTNTNTIKKKNKGGRPKKIIDYDKVYDYALVCCTQEEIATMLGFERRMFADNEKLSHVYKKGVSNAKLSLRRMQFIMAEDNPTIAIWLGKQLLGQRDKHDIDQTVTEKRVQIVNDLPKEQKKKE